MQRSKFTRERQYYQKQHSNNNEKKTANVISENDKVFAAAANLFEINEKTVEIQKAKIYFRIM